MTLGWIDVTTVSELIAMLAELPPGDEVWAYDHDDPATLGRPTMIQDTKFVRGRAVPLPGVWVVFGAPY